MPSLSAPLDRNDATVAAQLATLRIGFFGAGRVARALAPAWQQAGLSVRGVASRSHSSAQHLAQRLPACTVYADAQTLMEDCDLLFLTIPDDALSTVAAGLQVRPGQIVAHCSGACDLEMLAPVAEQGGQTAGFHPLFLFAGLPDDSQRLRGCSITLEAAPALHPLLIALVQALDCQPLQFSIMPLVESDSTATPISNRETTNTIPTPVADAAARKRARMLYHVGANYAATLALSLLKEATMLWREAGIAEDEALAALLPLLRGTLDSAHTAGLAGALSGPISRADSGILARHLQALGTLEGDHAALYASLSQRALHIAAQRPQTRSAALQDMAAVLRPHLP